MNRLAQGSLPALPGDYSHGLSAGACVESSPLTVLKVLSGQRPTFEVPARYVFWSNGFLPDRFFSCSDTCWWAHDTHKRFHNNYAVGCAKQHFISWRHVRLSTQARLITD